MIAYVVHLCTVVNGYNGRTFVICVSVDDSQLVHRASTTVPDGLQAHQQDLPAPTGISRFHWYFPLCLVFLSRQL